jgi:chromate reductase
VDSSFQIVGIAGSLRKASYSHVVLRAIAQLLPADSSFRQLDIGELPHYNEDVERAALPPSVAAARDLVSESHAVLIVTPEFNHGLPGVLKNTLDWLSRPAFKGCMVHRPVFFLTLSPGALGGVRAQYQLRETLSSMLCILPPMREVAIPHIGSKAPGGELVDPVTLGVLGEKLQAFLEFARKPQTASVL